MFTINFICFSSNKILILNRLFNLMDKTPFFQSTLSKWEKILDKLPHRSYFKSDKDDKSKENLNGADGSGSSKNNETSSKKSVTEDEIKSGSDKKDVDQPDSSQLNK